MSESLIRTGSGGTMLAGPDAVALFRAVAVQSGLRLYAACGVRPNRAWTPTNMLRAATGITGKPYKRGEYVRAADDVKIWCDAMRAALPVIHE